MSLRKVTPQELLESGIVQEVNRQFLHPLGYALTVHTSDDDPTARWLTVGHCDDDDGYAFETLDDDEARDKAAKVKAIADKLTPVRLARLGFNVQPIGHAFWTAPTSKNEDDTPSR